MGDKQRAYIAADYADEVSGRCHEPRYKPSWMKLSIYVFMPIVFWAAVIWWIFG